MAFRGERFTIDLPEDDEGVPETSHPLVGGPMNLIGEIQERSTSADADSIPPVPTPISTSTGFPAHKKRTGPSRFKQQRTGQACDAPPQITPQEPSPTSAKPSKADVERDERRAIDEENKRRLAAMSPAQVEREREELMAGLPPSLLERFLRRANIEEEPESHRPAKDTTIPSQSERMVESSKIPPAAYVEDATEEPASKAPVSFDVPATEKPSGPITSDTPPPEEAPASFASSDDQPPSNRPEEIFPVGKGQLPPPPPIHFPTALRDSPMPNLDPSSPSFLSDLQKHYFPDTSHDPSSLAWMQPPSATVPDPADASNNSAYHPDSDAPSIAPSALRFTLTGTILSPSTALALPTTLGLHHHAADPQAAGYTIPELAILSRSTVPAQRCVAWQVLGRILYRLGKGEFGQKGSALVDGLWDAVEGEKVVAGMLAEANGGDNRAGGNQGGIGRHASAKAWAVEGIWLWKRGGGGDRGLLKEGAKRAQ